MPRWDFAHVYATNTGILRQDVGLIQRCFRIVFRDGVNSGYGSSKYYNKRIREGCHD